jgi:predicted transcriptional regulator of viral defense system
MLTKRAKDAERRLARLAAGQHGVVSLDQLRTIGISADAARQRVRAGRPHRVHQAVYAVGHDRLSDEGRWMAAVLAYGDKTVLSHRSAAELWRMLNPRPGAVDVTVPGRSGRRERPGIRLHRTTTLTQPETTRRAGIPVTSVARTLLDLRRCITPDELSCARRQAEFFGSGQKPPTPSRSS